MAIALALASVCAFAPLHFTGWLSLPADLVLRLIAPVSHPARLFASWIDPPRSARRRTRRNRPAAR
jgi:hypothetical protein